MTGLTPYKRRGAAGPHGIEGTWRWRALSADLSAAPPHPPPGATIALIALYTAKQIKNPRIIIILVINKIIALCTRNRDLFTSQRKEEKAGLAFLPHGVPGRPHVQSWGYR